MRGIGGRWRRAVLAVLAGVAVLAAAVAYGVVRVRGCGGADVLTLDVAAAPEIAPAVRSIAARFGEERHAVGGRCVRARVRAVEPYAMSVALSGNAPLDGGLRRPDVWIPDTSAWAHLAGSSGVVVTRTSVATTPLVAVLPGRPKGGAPPSWHDLLGTRDEKTTKRIAVPDPARDGAGITALLLARWLARGTRRPDATFVNVVRAMRQNLTPDARTAASADVVLTTEQAVSRHNGRGVAVHPSEGSLSLDYPVVLTGPRSGTQGAAVRMLERALRDGRARRDVRSLGFRATGEQPAALDPGEVRDVVQSWARLSLGTRMLSLLDVSGSMAQTVPGTHATRMQTLTRVAQEGLAFQPDDTELGQWVFATELDGSRDWRENVPVGPLGERVGSATRRQRILSALSALRPEPGGRTGLYDAVLAAFRYMRRTYKPEMVNSVLVMTDGRNDDADGPTLDATVAALRREYDPGRPVQIIVIGFGADVDPAELRRITEVTRGGVHIARNPADIRKIFGTAMARRMCAPDC
ncbi:substrate-binding and VWA domain-containing protein [Actinomadura miaoliensis]|uniref:Substrate-binding and VWA domain-containing protein n=1 Tax=Actinomadura miaoliensis TaxID=430685 RepID=A0ABP7V3W8_9ACTN